MIVKRLGRVNSAWVVAGIIAAAAIAVTTRGDEAAPGPQVLTAMQGEEKGTQQAPAVLC